MISEENLASEKEINPLSAGCEKEKCTVTWRMVAEMSARQGEGRAGTEKELLQETSSKIIMNAISEIQRKGQSCNDDSKTGVCAAGN